MIMSLVTMDLLLILRRHRRASLICCWQAGGQVHLHLARPWCVLSLVDICSPCPPIHVFNSAGDHSICLKTSGSSGWFSSTHVKFYFDIAVGSSRPDSE
jgi:hypothetical protein